ncbi:hypothetical protein R4P64_33260 [Rhodococcus sp. IEGM 1366]|uniref:hypothetical protein n=1 Tax=Rhodococcus sp. IEGM 1366 TaxID=3082223 RepID=UPI00295599E5|nr:hypothetical protein [Rhodococcus sp. IEGM 1366]MDV8071383.1 hypothetical protein [Rhodococcus sp. IEGM 1366]
MAASKLNISELAFAKDYWVCEALRAVLAHAGDDLVFTGGTSLEKMRLVQRFPRISTCWLPAGMATSGRRNEG